MSNRDAAADRAVCEGMTPGNWVVKDGNWIKVERGQYIAEFEEPRDARCIVALHDALPHWIDRAEAAEAEVERLRNQCASLQAVNGANVVEMRAKIDCLRTRNEKLREEIAYAEAEVERLRETLQVVERYISPGARPDLAVEAIRRALEPAP